MDDRVKRLKTPEDCESFAKNAQESHPHLALEAHRRAVELRAAAYGAKTDAEREALEVVYAVEEVLSYKNHKKTRASRTWQSIKQHGILGTVERVVSRAKETDGYESLAEMGMEDLTFEAVVLRHPQLFQPETVERAESRLAERKQA